MATAGSTCWALSADGQPMRALNSGKKSYRWQIIRADGESEGGRRAHQLLRARRRDRGACRLAGAEADRSTGRSSTSAWASSRCRRRPHRLAQRRCRSGSSTCPPTGPIVAAQRLSGSCPFLFTFDGDGHAFRRRLHVGHAAGHVRQRPEQGRLPADHRMAEDSAATSCVPRDGYYDVRVHANLWETDYFDQLALIVVDHPPDTEIHVDERFFLTPTPPRLYVTAPARPVAQAWDHHGKDVTDEVRAIDGRYLDRCRRGRFQGVTRDHWVEVGPGRRCAARRAGVCCWHAAGCIRPTARSTSPSPRASTTRRGRCRWRCPTARAAGRRSARRSASPPARTRRC